MRVIFAGTPEFAVSPLRALLKEHEVAAVFTQPDRKSGRGKKLTPPPVKAFALEQEIDVFQPTSLKDKVELIASFKADIMVVVAYGMLLPQSILDTPKLGCLNIHASLLPRWRGAAPIQRAIEAGDTETGVSIMQMELGLDTGPVFEMFKTPISIHDTSASLHDTLSVLGANGICKVLTDLSANPELKPQTQDGSASNYAKKINKADAEIDWSKNAIELHQQLRAFIPWPVSQTHHGGTRIRIWEASVIQHKHGAKPGEIVNTSDEGITVACGLNLLRLEKLQRDGSKPLSFKEFKNGYSLTVGQHLGAIDQQLNRET